MTGLTHRPVTARFHKHAFVALIICAQIVIIVFTLYRMCQLIADNNRRQRLDSKLPDDPSLDDEGELAPASNALGAGTRTGSHVEALMLALRGDGGGSGDDDDEEIRQDGHVLLNDLLRIDARPNIGRNTSINVHLRVPHNVRRLERLVNVALSAKYQLQELSTREQLNPVVDVLSKVVRRRTNFERRLSSRHLSHRRISPTAKKLNIFKDTEKLEAWKRFHNGISSLALYSDCNSVADDVLRDLKTLPIFALKPSNPQYTSQMHFFYELQNRAKALFKPKRVARDYEKPVDGEVFHDMERHTAEIAAFHLDRILGFRRVPPAAGRKVDMLEDIRNMNHYNATGGIYVSTDGHDCFDGTCEANCDDRNPICADDHGQLEGSMSAVFPVWLTSEIENPYYAVCLDCSSSLRSLADFQRKFDRGSDYCESEVRRKDPFKRDRSMLHLIDMHIFDFLIGNLDRHHFCVFDEIEVDSFFVAFDNGKGFGSSLRDELSLLAPLYQCCMVRLSTVHRLLELYTGSERLSDVMRRSLKTDLLHGVLTESHLHALDRRLALVLGEIYNCIRDKSDRSVLIGDEI